MLIYLDVIILYHDVIFVKPFSQRNIDNAIFLRYYIVARREHDLQDRIKELRKSLGLTQKDFGERLGVQANTITSYESGVRTPNNSMILAICREYGVSETWLRTGEGEMKQKLTRNQEIAEFMATVMRDPDDAPRKRFISIVSKLDIEEWQLLEAIAKKWTEDE